MAGRLELTGQKFGRLTVEKFDCSKNSRTYWLCICECGNLKSVQGKKLKSGHTRSCGCLVTESAIRNLSNVSKNGRETHGKRHTRLYGIWTDMKKRCNNSNHTSYMNYGGRGISVCDEWQKDFQSFYEWAVKNGYNDELSIERIDVNGNYEPVNCKWITLKEQSYNKRNNIVVTIYNTTKTLAEWSEDTGLNYGTLKSRYHKGDRGQRLIRPVRNKRAE